MNCNDKMGETVFLTSRLCAALVQIQLLRRDAADLNHRFAPCQLPFVSGWTRTPHHASLRIRSSVWVHLCSRTWAHNMDTHFLAVVLYLCCHRCSLAYPLIHYNTLFTPSAWQYGSHTLLVQDRTVTFGDLMRIQGWREGSMLVESNGNTLKHIFHFCSISDHQICPHWTFRRKKTRKQSVQTRCLSAVLK